jgi:hypothetical protein
VGRRALSCRDTRILLPKQRPGDWRSLWSVIDKSSSANRVLEDLKGRALAFDCSLFKPVSILVTSRLSVGLGYEAMIYKTSKYPVRERLGVICLATRSP